MNETRRLPAAAAALIAVTLSACGGGGGDVVTTGGNTGTGTGGGTGPAQAAAKACDISSFAGLNLDNAVITSATPIAANSYKPAGSSTAIANLAAFCQVKGQATPTSDSLINFEMWVPQSGWNGKLVTTGNGGYSPALNYSDMANAMRQGYAVLGGDTGHQSADPNDMFWGVGHPEKIKDWGTRSIHAITVPAKSALAQLQGQAASRAYYYGCSTGGHQAYAEVQNYPGDFDGVIAGDPGNNRVALNAEFLWRFESNRVPNTNTQILTSAKVKLITQSAIAACDSLDGVTDGVMTDPRACTTAHFNIDSLLCSGADAPTCLTADQIAAAKKIYQGPRNATSGAQIYPGLLVGTESGWPGYWGSTAPVRSDFWALWSFDDPNWNWWTFDWDRDYTFTQAKLSPLVDQVNPNISAFKASGAKLITYQGFADPVVNPLDTISYYEQVRTAQGSQAATDSFFRLFMVPGMGHCNGGSGWTNFGNQGGYVPAPTPQNDVLMALDQWVDKGVAPDSIVAAKLSSGAVTSTRPLCAYPKQAVYKGSGSTDDAANFTCQ